MSTSAAPWNPIQRVLAGAAALALAVSALVLGGATAASAAPADALTVTIIKPDGTAVEPGEVVPEGTALKLRIQYQKQDAPNDLTGTTQTVQLGTGVTIDGVPSGNTAVTGVTPNGNGFDLTFASPWPGDVNQGYLDLDFVVDSVTETGEQAISWQAGTKSGSLTIVVKDDDDVFEDIDSFAASKGVSPGNLNSYVQVGPDDAPNENEIVFQGLSASVIGVPLTYTLTVELPAGTDGTDFDISDQLPAGLSVVPGSFTSTLTTWDDNGWNQTVTTLDGSTTPAAFSGTVTGAGTTGQGFTGQIDLPDPSILTITYQARIADEDSRVVVENALRAQADALGGNSGSFSHTLRNSAQFDYATTPRTADVTLTGTIPGPCATGCGGSSAFGKAASGGTVNVIADDTGLIVDEDGEPAPVEVTYTLRADLSQWDGSNSNYTLDRNVVISDTLAPQLSWNTAASGFLIVTAGTGSPITGLTQVTCPAGTATASLGAATTAYNVDGFVGTYCIDGQRLLINVGKNAATDVTIALKTLLHRVDGLSASGTSTILGATRYELPNQAQFWHRNGARSNANAPQYPTRLPEDRSPGLNDSAAFSKSGPSGPVVVEQGERAVVPYTFQVDTEVAGVSAADARIEDAIDTSVFDLSDLSAIVVTSSYTGAGDISGDVELSFAEGILTIALAEGVTLDAGGTWIVTLNIPTHPLVDKQTLEISNYASLYGTGDDPQYWSQDSSRATSFGDELEVRKHVYDRGAEDWSQVLVAAEDENGELIDDVYVYRLQLVAHGSFSGAILDVIDLLPAEAEFLGFVDAADVADGDPVHPDTTLDLSHGIQAVFDAAAGPQGQITLTQASGGMPVGGEVAAYFAVRIDPTVPEMVVNTFGGQSATIVPGGPSIDIEKWNDEGAAPEYDDAGALLNDGYAGDHDTAPGATLTAGEPETIRFTVSNDGPEPLVDIEVGDRLDSGAGELSGLLCMFPDDSTGTTWAGPFAPGAQFECEAELPALQTGQTHADTAWVTAVGQASGIPVDDEDPWHGRVPTPLSVTGAELPLNLFGLAGVLVVLGGGLLLVRRSTVLR